MVKEVRIFKMRLYKNDDANGGAMNSAIKDLTPDKILFHSQTKKNGRLWGTCYPEELLKLTEKNNGIYEVNATWPLKVYFDYDGKLDTPLSKEQSTIYLQKILSHIDQIFPNGDWAISGSITDTKISYHIISNNYIIRNEFERQQLKAIVKYMYDNLDTGFDWKVYTKNRNMKAINQSKDDGRIQQIIFCENWKKHFITCFHNEFPLPFPDFIPEIKEQIMIQKSKAKFDIGLLPKLNKVSPENIIWSKITADEVLNLLPCSKDFNHDYTHRVARFCYTNDITLQSFLSWISQKHNPLSQDIANKWNIHWNNLHKYPPIYIEGMKPILAYYYPDIKKDIRLREFRGLFNISDTIEKINIDRLDQSHFSQNHKVTILHLGMGSGKTAQTIDYLTKNENFCWIGHRQSLHQNTLSRILDAGLECTDYQKGTAKNKSELYNNSKALSICLNSLHYLNHDTYFSTIVIDEIESLLDVFTMTGTIMKNKKIILSTLYNLLKKAKKIIVIDAFITNRTIEFLQTIDPLFSMQIVYKPVQLSRTLIFKNAIKDEEKSDDFAEDNQEIDNNKNMMIDEICSIIASGKKVFIFYPYKKDMEEMYVIIKERVLKKIGTTPKGIFYNSDIDDSTKQTLKCVNETWIGLDFVITNSCITCGVNFDLKGFDSVWLFLSYFVKPREAIQVSARIRHIESNIINVCFLGRLTNTTTYINDTKDVNNPIYTNIYNNFLIEDMSPRRKTFEIFCGKAGYQMKKETKVINREISREIQNLFQNTDCSIGWDQIEKIDHSVADILQNNICCHISTMYERLCLQKYFFLLNFDAMVDESKLENIWNSGYKDFFEKYKEATTDSSIFIDIQKENKWHTIFPPNNCKTIKISTQTIDKIFSKFIFRNLQKNSSPILIFKNIINSHFGKSIINNIVDNTRHSNIQLDEDFTDLYDDIFEVNKHFITL